MGQIGRTTLYLLNREGVIKSVRIGKRRMYLASSVDEYIQSQVEPAGDANSTAAESNSHPGAIRRNERNITHAD